MTPDQLLKELNRQGRKVIRRRITKWLEWGLLPPLVPRGRGQGLGKEYFWQEDNILEQAKAAYDYMQLDCQAETALLGLWFMGHKIDSGKFREAFISRWTKLTQPLNQIIQNADDPDDALNDISKPHTGKIAKLFSLEKYEIEQGIRDIYKLFLVPNTSIEDVEYFINEDGLKILKRIILFAVPEDTISAVDIIPFLNFCKRAVAPQNIYNLLNSVTNEDIQHIQTLWIKIWNYLCPLILSNIPYFNQQGDKFAPPEYLAIYFGRVIVLGLLYLQKIGGGHKLENSIIEIINFLDNFNLPDFINEINQVKSLENLPWKPIGELVEFGGKIQHDWQDDFVRAVKSA